MSDKKDDFIESDHNDVVVNIATESQHLDNSDVNEWLKPDDNGFRATPQQETSHLPCTNEPMFFH